MLEELSKRDDEWRKIALKIVRFYNVDHRERKHLSDDLVQQMYINLYEKGVKWVDIKDSVSFYVYIVIRNMFYNYVKEKKKTVSIETLDNKQYEEINDKEEMVFLFTDELNKMRFLYREILMLNKGDGMSMRKIAKANNITLSDVFNTCRTAKQLLIERFYNTYNEFKN